MHQINCLRGCTYDYSHIECVSLTFPWRLCMWFFNKVVALNIFSHYLQGSFMLMWMTWWVLSSWDCEKAFEHAMHEKGFSPVCVLLWCVRRAHLLKALSRSLHWKGLVWLCTFLCVFKCEDCEKVCCIIHNWILSHLHACPCPYLGVAFGWNFSHTAPKCLQAFLK